MIAECVMNALVGNKKRGMEQYCNAEDSRIY